MSVTNTAFFHAVRHGNAAKVEQALATGSDPNARNQSGRPVLHMATSPEVIRLLIKAGADLEARDRKEELTALETACDGQLEAVRALIAANADVNARHDRGYSTFMTAVQSDRRSTPAIVRLLLESGAESRHLSDLGYNTIHAWVGFGDAPLPNEDYEEILKILLAEGVDIDARDSRGFTPLLLALSYGSSNAGQTLCLLRNGANPNLAVEHPTRNGYLHSATPLMLSVDSPEVVEALLEAGADPHVLDENGNTAQDFAEMNLQGLEFSEDEEDIATVDILERSITLLRKATA